MAAAVLTPTTPREKKRARERRSRARRVVRYVGLTTMGTHYLKWVVDPFTVAVPQANFERMRSTKDALERMELVLRTIDDDDTVWEGFLDDDAMRVRRGLRQSIVLANELRALLSEQAQLQRLLREHELASRTIESMVMGGQRVSDDWDWQVRQWRELTRRKYRPWTLTECAEEMTAALKEVHAFQWSTDKLTSGISFLGWREVRRVDRLRGSFQFEFYKTFADCEIMDYVNVGWDSYTNSAVFCEVNVPPRARGFHEVLQQLGPNMVIVHRVLQYGSIGVHAHAVFLVFRVKTERGFTQCVRSIVCPELVNVMDGPWDKWPSNFIWLQWDHLHGEHEIGYTLRIGGSMGEIDADYAHQWLFGALGSVLRSEQKATGRKLITSD